MNTRLASVSAPVPAGTRGEHTETIRLRCRSACYRGEAVGAWACRPPDTTDGCADSDAQRPLDRVVQEVEQAVRVRSRLERGLADDASLLSASTGGTTFHRAMPRASIDKDNRLRLGTRIAGTGTCRFDSSRSLKVSNAPGIRGVR